MAAVTVTDLAATDLKCKISYYFVETTKLAASLQEYRIGSSSLSYLLLRVVFSSVINTLGEVLDEADALSYADLFLLRQLGGQTGLAGCGVVHGHVSLLLVGQKPSETLTLQVKKKNKIIKHLPHKIG